VGSILGAVMLALVIGAPAAQARTDHQSTSCALSSLVKFRPGLVQDHARRVFIRFDFKLTRCEGGGVASATGFGGGVGTLRCTSGRGIAKAEVDWDTGAKSFLNFTVNLRKESLYGQVVDGLFKGDRMSATAISVRPIRGDCVTSPLTKAKVTGTLGL